MREQPWSASASASASASGSASTSASPRGGVPRAGRGPYTVRHARRDELGLLGAIETAADSVFPPGVLPSAEVHGVPELTSAVDDGLLLVAEDTDSRRVVGFAVASDEGEWMFVHQISVHPSFARRGIGADLLDAIETDARARGHLAAGLTTFRSFEWNGPFYTRRGYVELSADVHRADLVGVLDAALSEEGAMGFDPADRVALVKAFEA